MPDFAEQSLTPSGNADLPIGQTEATPGTHGFDPALPNAIHAGNADLPIGDSPETHAAPAVPAPTPAPESFTPAFIRERILAAPQLARVVPWGLRPYAEILALQESLRTQRQADAIPDTWLVGEHPTVITQGVRGAAADLVGESALPTFQIDRGGQTTLHNPGQLVVYPIIRTQGGVLAQARVSRALLATFAAWIEQLTGVALEIPRGRPGLFHQNRKVAALGISIHSRVTMHGIAINLNNDLTPWRTIIPCGEPETRPITLSEVAGREITPSELTPQLSPFLQTHWSYSQATSAAFPSAQ